MKKNQCTLIFALYVTIGPRQGKTLPFVQICFTSKPYEAQRCHSCSGLVYPETRGGDSTGL